ncbi:pyruvate dehydrogenase E1 component subunit beta-1, mitochondrial [Tanacetum coccineum]|uniref:Pyruvate dehydrogenase E1 component subunit beta n=1 Tax=Tanacetum coccineum TaxID=301880 RepID=A0ABQ5CPQ8_9ASTR
MKVEESLNVKFDESPPPKSPPLEDDDIVKCEIIENKEKDLEIKENEPLNKDIINIKESKDHPLETVIEDVQVKNYVPSLNWLVFPTDIATKRGVWNMLTGLVVLLIKGRLVATAGASGTELIFTLVYLFRAIVSASRNPTKDALNSALDEEMVVDPNVFVMGEEVGEYQGAYKINKGLLDKYGPERVVDTPITEAIDHIINSTAKLNYMSAGQINMPIVFRGPNRHAADVGAQHSHVSLLDSLFS